MDIPTLSITTEFLECLDSPVLVTNNLEKPIYCNSAFSSFAGQPKAVILHSHPSRIDLPPFVDKSIDWELISHPRSYKLPVKLGEQGMQLIVIAGLNSPASSDCCRNGEGDDVSFCGARDLSPRELDVLRLFMQGKSIKAVASRLEISSHTVSGHAKSLHIKLGVRSRSELLACAFAKFRNCRALSRVAGY